MPELWYCGTKPYPHHSLLSPLRSFPTRPRATLYTHHSSGISAAFSCILHKRKMATPARLTVKKVKPILSLNRDDARRRVIALYKSYYRHIPQMLLEYDIPKTKNECQQKLREEFDRHRNVTDLRVIDLLVAKGQMKLQEISHFWITKGGLMDNFKDTVEPKPKDFMGKFLSGQDSTI